LISQGKYGEPSIEGYYKKLAAAYLRVIGDGKPSSSVLNVDCANGVGAPKLEALLQVIGQDQLTCQLINTNIRGHGVLNFECGADYVKVCQFLLIVQSNILGRSKTTR
jgi:phosphoacetylglucosamine mutase